MIFTIPAAKRIGTLLFEAPLPAKSSLSLDIDGETARAFMIGVTVDDPPAPRSASPAGSGLPELGFKNARQQHPLAFRFTRGGEGTRTARVFISSLSMLLLTPTIGPLNSPQMRSAAIDDVGVDIEHRPRCHAHGLQCSAERR